MKTQAWGWLTAGVLALGLNGIYQDGGAAWAHRAVGHVVERITERTGPVLALATGRAELFMARTGMVAARSEATACRLFTSLSSARAESRIARGHAGFDRLESMSEREESAISRMEANRERMDEDLAGLNFSRVQLDGVQVSVGCPRIRVNIPRIDIPQINIPRVPAVNLLAPLVHVDLSGTGPV